MKVRRARGVPSGSSQLAVGSLKLTSQLFTLVAARLVRFVTPAGWQLVVFFNSVVVVVVLFVAFMHSSEAAQVGAQPGLSI